MVAAIPGESAFQTYAAYRMVGKRDSIHQHLLEAISETADVLELRQRLCTPPPLGGGGGGGCGGV